MPGFIHDKLDVKLLLLYITALLEGPVEFSTLTDLAQCDGGVNYFVLAECIHELVDSGHLSTDGTCYAITPKGLRNTAASASSLSPVVRAKCDKNVAPVNDALRRKAQIRSSVEVDPTGTGWLLRLCLSDGTVEHLTLSLWCPTEEYARKAEKRFQDDPGAVYDGFLSLLLEEKEGDTP